MRPAGIFALSGAAFFSALGNAHANDAFDAFQKMCLATRGVGVQSIAIAEGNGWTPISDATRAELSKGEIADVQGRFYTTKTSMILLLVGKEPTTNYCAISISPGDPQFIPLAAQMAAVPPDASSEEGHPFYIWQEKDGVHLQVKKDSADFGPLFSSGAVTSIFASIDANMSTVALVAPIEKPAKTP